MEVPEINYQTDFEKDDGGWHRAGWIRTNNFVPQRYVVQLVSFGKDGQITVTRLPVNADNTAKWDIPLSQLEKADGGGQPHGVQDHRGGALQLVGARKVAELQQHRDS